MYYPLSLTSTTTTMVMIIIDDTMMMIIGIHSYKFSSSKSIILVYHTHKQTQFPKNKRTNNKIHSKIIYGDSAGDGEYPNINNNNNNYEAKKFIYRKKEMQRLNIKKEQRQVYNPIDYEKKSKSGSILNWVVFFVVVVFGVW